MPRKQIQREHLAQQVQPLQQNQEQQNAQVWSHRSSKEQQRIWKEENKEAEDKFFDELIEKNERFKKIKELKDYVKLRNSQSWTKNYDECALRAAKIDKKFRKLYFKYRNAQKWGEENQGDAFVQLEWEAQDLLNTMEERDAAQKEIRDKTTFSSFGKEIDNIIAESSSNDSKEFSRIVELAEKYKAEQEMEKKMDIVWQMQAAVREYTKLRYKTSYGWRNGLRRMGIMDRMTAMIDRVLEFKNYFDLKAENKRKHKFLADEMNTLYEKEKDETYTKYCENNHVPIVKERWAQILLPYERDESGRVTEKTKENYEINQKTLRVFRTDDTKRKIAALARVYLKQKWPVLNEDSFTIDNLLRIQEEGYAKNTIESNKMILIDLLNGIKAKGSKDPLVTYMLGRVSNETMRALKNAFSAYMDSIGYHETEDKIGMVYAENLQLAKSLVEIAKTEFVNYTQVNEELEQELRDLVEEVDEEEELEEKNPESDAYVGATARILNKRLALEKKVREDFDKRYSQYVNGKDEYWKQPNRICALMLPYAVDQKGNVTKKTQKNCDKNGLLLQLLHSENAEDRIAALASIYLRLYKLEINGDNITEKDVNIITRGIVCTDVFFSQYATFSDFLKDEEERSGNDPRIKYMIQQFERPVFTELMSIRSMSFSLHNYDYEGNYKELDADNKDAVKSSFDATLESANDALEQERKDNNGALIHKDDIMESELQQLCREKGLL